jgi:hypothetical protein
MTKYMLMFIDRDGAWDGVSKEQNDKVQAGIMKWWGELMAKGAIHGQGKLASKDHAITVRRVNGSMRVTDGPFIESKEHVGGFGVVQAADLDEAISIAKGMVALLPEGLGLEVRPVVEH